MIETLVVVYTAGALVTAFLVAWFDGGFDYVERMSRYGTYTTKKTTIRREGETGLHATGRIIVKAIGWPAVAWPYIVALNLYHRY